MKNRMLKLEAVQEFVKGRSIAVVGNAASLLEKKQGKLIDDHDIVVRMNLGIPGVRNPGLEKRSPELEATPLHIGKRMDCWAGTPCPGRPKIKRTDVPGTHMSAAIDLGHEWNARLHQCWVVPWGAWWPVPELMAKTYDGTQVKEDAKVELNGKARGSVTPTTGFVVCFLLTQRCEPAEVVAYGMDGFKTTSYPTGQDGGGHDGEREMKWLLAEDVEVR